MLLILFRPDECSLGRLEPHVERENGETGGGHDCLCAVPGCSSGVYNSFGTTKSALIDQAQPCVHNYHFISPQGMFDYLDNAVIKLCDMPAVGTDLSTVKQQIEELKVWIRPYLHLSKKKNTLRKRLTLFLFTWHSNIKWKFTSSRLIWRNFATKESCYSEKWATKQTETWFKSLSLSYATYGTTWWTKAQSDRWGNTDVYYLSLLLHLKNNCLWNR